MLDEAYIKQHPIVKYEVFGKGRNNHLVVYERKDGSVTVEVWDNQDHLVAHYEYNKWVPLYTHKVIITLKHDKIIKEEFTSEATAIEYIEKQLKSLKDISYISIKELT